MVPDEDINKEDKESLNTSELVLVNEKKVRKASQWTGSGRENKKGE